MYLSYDIRNPNEVVHDYMFTATSAFSPNGIYVPYPDLKCSNSTEGCRMRRSAEDEQGGDDEVELYGTLVGLNPGMKNWYKLKIVEGFETVGDGAAHVCVSLVAMVMSFLISLWY